MEKMRIKRNVVLLFIVCCLSATTVYAAVTQNDIDHAKDQVENIQQKVDDAEKELDEHNQTKDKLEGNLKNLNTNLQTLTSELGNLQGQIAKKQAEIEEITAELQEAQVRSAQQYEDMKLRIQFMYENANTSVMSMLLGADSMSDFLNQTEYVTNINMYDREKLEEYQILQEEIAEKKALLEEEEKELLALKEDVETKQSKVNLMIAATEQTISQTNAAIADTQAEREDLEEQLAYWEEYERKLEAEKLAQDLALWKELQEAGLLGVQFDSYTAAQGEAYLLAAIIQCEAWGESYEGKLAVGSVVMNRVAHSRFPDSITGVIYQNQQFAPVASGRLDYRLQNGVTEECKQAALEVLNGNITNDCLFFRTVIPGIDGTIIGNHIFY